MRNCYFHPPSQVELVVTIEICPPLLWTLKLSQLQLLSENGFDFTEDLLVKSACLDLEVGLS